MPLEVDLGGLFTAVEYLRDHCIVLGPECHAAEAFSRSRSGDPHSPWAHKFAEVRKIVIEPCIKHLFFLPVDNHDRMLRVELWIAMNGCN